ncbi:helix-turn-helix transcriptional regulator [Nocardia terpenica]|nr:helix-turn-helix transcriptional regulator [Nocardia terpenica]MBF6106753.1 helix-turn-helix transcriptional regulator [Nocardia terpenica]MBF6114591.1 helix-turn-helix transcriptional regulator [Nocardia terpenica]MBF6121323.1 helix-turn-helix transcriptional regulator [Nocardia terpenica]MBF6153738.1 helix-turn-helix transcriptional regulator [Nocardia terpenica]
MLDDMAGMRTGERIQAFRERKGLSRPVLAGLVGMSPSWLKGIERGSRLPPRLPMLVKLAEALGTSDVAVLAGTDLDLGGSTSIPVDSFGRIPHDALPAIREAVRAPLLRTPTGTVDIAALASRTAQAWRVWHHSSQHRTDVGRILPRLITDARIAVRTTEGGDRRRANAVLTDIYALAQHEVVWASEAELVWIVADRAMAAAQDADTPMALASAAWTLGMVQRTTGDTDAAIGLVNDAADLLTPALAEGGDEVRAMYGALRLHAATTAARAGREGDAWRYWDAADGVAARLDARYHHPWTMFGASNVELHAVSISIDLSKSADARSRAEGIDPESIPSRERRGRLGVEIARSYHQRRDYPAMLHWLEYAYRTANDSVRYSPTARQMVADALTHGGALISHRARSLAGSIGLGF